MVSDVDWDGELRRLNVEMAGWWDGRDMKGTFRLVVEKAARAQASNTPEATYELQKAAERLDREVQIYAQRLEKLREDIGYFIAAIVEHRARLAKEDVLEGRFDRLTDDDIVDRLAAFYNLPKQGPK